MRRSRGRLSSDRGAAGGGDRRASSSSARASYTHAHSVAEAIRLIDDHGCTHASLDHDLGNYADDGGDGYDLVVWMAEHDRWPTEGIAIHSANVVGLRRMLGVIDRYGHYPDGWTHTRGNWPSDCPAAP
jgi:hypothetical protein